jgi:hypothetical protein
MPTDLQIVPTDFGEDLPGMAFVSLFRLDENTTVWHIERFGASSNPYGTRSLCGCSTDFLAEGAWKTGYCLPDRGALVNALHEAHLFPTCLRCLHSWAAGYCNQCVNEQSPGLGGNDAQPGG